MAQLADLEFRTIIEDARTRHAAVVALIYQTDAQAMGLLRLYSTLGVTTASGAIAGFAHVGLVSKPLAWALSAATIMFVMGAGFCLRALQSSKINLPGRKADFWDWAQGPDVDRRAVLKAYLDNLSEKSSANDALNAKTSNALRWAKRIAVLAPLFAFAAGIAAAFLST